MSIEFKAGDKAICRGWQGYAFTQGKRYEILAFEAAEMSNAIGFTWPAYVHVIDDNGKRVTCHAERFVPIEEVL